MAARVTRVLVAVAAAGALFVSGTLVNASVRAGIEGFLGGVQQKLLQAAGRAPAPAPAAAPAAAAAAPAPAAAGSASAPAAAVPAGAAASTVPLASLLLPATPPPGRSYALQAGQFASQLAATQLAASINGQGMTSTVIVTQDIGGTTWAVVSLGSFPSADEAAAQRTYLANRLGLPDYMPTLLLPAPAAPASAAAAPASAPAGNGAP